MSNGDPVIDARDVTIRFGKFTAVDRLTLAVHPGEVFALLGPNGSGKTTLIRALCGLVPLSEGTATVLGCNVAVDADAVRSRIGYMSQKFSLYQDLTVVENMNFYAGVYGLSAARAKERKADLVELTGLAPYLNQRAGRLSGGWKQRLALVCALLHEPRLIFLDEPTAGIDPVARRDIWDLLFQLTARGITLVVTTHYMDEAERCDRVGYLYLSHLLALGRPRDLRQDVTVTPPGCHWVEIVGPEMSLRLEKLRHSPGVRQATIFGQAIHALVEERAFDPASAGAGAHVEATDATLEDVFVTYTRAQAAENGKAVGGAA